jgi:hypothetical protein
MIFIAIAMALGSSERSLRPTGDVNGVDTVLTDIAEVRTRDILEQGPQGALPNNP